MSEANETPRGEVVLRTVAMPADTNPNGDIFGGWLLAQMDLAGGLAAAAHVRSRVTTVAINAMTFHKPVNVGDVVCCYADVQKIGNTSITLGIQAWVIRRGFEGQRIKVTEGVFIYVAIDETGRPQPVVRQ